MGDGVTQLCMDRRLYQKELSKSERAKQDRFVTALKSAATTPVSSTSTTPPEKEMNTNSTDSNHQNTTSTNMDLDRSTYLDSILEHLTPDDVRVLIRSEDELAQATHFSRIFPTQVMLIEIIKPCPIGNVRNLSHLLLIFICIF